MSIDNNNIEKIFHDYVDLKAVQTTKDIKDNISNELIDTFKAELSLMGNDIDMNTINNKTVLMAAEWLKEDDNTKFAFDNENIKDVKDSKDIGDNFIETIAVGFSLDADMNKVLREMYERDDKKINHNASRNDKSIEQE